MRKVVKAEVVQWEPGQWSVSITYGNGDGRAYFVGSREEAEAELKKIRPVRILRSTDA